MLRSIALLLLGLGAFAAGSAVVAAPQQSRAQLPVYSTERPGDPTQAQVLVQNRGENEAVPVSIERVASEAALRVEVIGTTGVSLVSPGVLQVRSVRHTWEYRTITLPSGGDAAAVLRAAGEDGWETTGHQFAASGGTQVLLKRPR
jgi:hypothetical protein